MGFGGGIHTSSGTASIIHCTFASNMAVAGHGGLGGSSVGGVPSPSDGRAGLTGLALGGCLGSSSATTSLARSILAYSIGVGNVAGLVTDGGHNLSTDDSLHGAGPGGDVDPRLGPLADNGGPTPTLALLEGSPAIDVLPGDGAVAADQRGVSRPVGGGSDIGAFEGTTHPPEIVSEFAPAGIDPGSVSVLRWTMHNPNPTALTGIAFTNQLPAGLLVWEPGDLSPVCEGTLVAAHRADRVVFAEGAVGAGGRLRCSKSCPPASCGGASISLPR